MDWLERMNNALDYIENSLDEEIDYKEIAKVANCSEFHFSRCFLQFLVYRFQIILDEGD